MDLKKVIDVPLSDIKLTSSNVRKDMDSVNSQDNLKELAENIKVNGLLQPIVLRGTFGKPPYEVIVGQRRFLAHKRLNKKVIPSTFSGTVDDIRALLLSLSENMCRQEMNFEDTSTAITTLYSHYKKDEYEVQKHTGFSIKAIRNYIKVTEQATTKIRAYLASNKVSMADAKRAIDAAQGDHKKADVLIDELVKLSKYEKKRLVESGFKNPKAKAADLLAEARQPKLEETIILNLPRKIHRALVLAASKLSVDIEELTISTLKNWLKINDYLVE